MATISSSTGKLNNISQRIRREIQVIKNESISVYLRELTDDSSTDYSLWKATRRLKRPIMHIPPIRQQNGEWARNDEQKAARFAEHLEETFQPNEVQDGEPFWDEPLQEEEEIRLTSPREVAKEIKENIHSKKAPGFDLITGEVLKQLPRKAIVKLTNLVNAAFRLKYVPRLWKVAEVIMVSKQGKPPNDVSSCRPISLLPVMSKLLKNYY